MIERPLTHRASTNRSCTKLVTGTLLLLLVAFIAAQTGAAGASNSQKGTSSRFEQLKGTVKQSATAFVKSAQAGFTTTEGRFRFWLLPDCVKSVAHGLTCYANNPSSPYGLFYVPPKPGNTLNASECFTKYLPFCDSIDGDTVAMPWQMEQDEAIVLVGISPPRMLYFGFTPYLFEHTYGPGWTPNTSLDEIARCHERRCDVFASMGDAVNMGNLNVSDKTMGPFAKPFAMVLTTSPTVYDQVRPLLEEQFPGAVNLLRFPGEMLDLGHGSGKDTIAGLLRLAFPADWKDHDDYVASAPFFLYRLTPRTSAELELYAKPLYCGTGQKYPIDNCVTVRNQTSEGDRIGGLTNEMLEAAAMTALQNIKQHVGHWWESVITEFAAAVPDLGFTCLDYGQHCQGDTRDTFYPKSDLHTMDAMINSELPQLKSTLLANESMFVVGVNHKEAGAASVYASMTLYDLIDLKGVHATADMDMLGSADAWLCNTESAPLSKYIYVIEYARDCGGRPGCVVVPSLGGPEELNIPLEHPILFIERSYYDATTGVSPGGQGMIKPKVLKTKKHNSLPAREC